MKHNNNTPLINTPRSRYTISFSDRDVWYVDNIEDELVQSKLSSDSSHIIRRTFPVSSKDLENKVLKDIKEDDERVKRENENRRLRNIDDNILQAIEDRAVDQQINLIRGK